MATPASFVSPAAGHPAAHASDPHRRGVRRLSPPDRRLYDAGGDRHRARRRPWAVVTVILFAATLVGMVGIYGYGQGRMGARDHLDERQRLMVDQALVRAYAALTTVIVVIAGILALVLSGSSGRSRWTCRSSRPGSSRSACTCRSLPFAALAWIEPDAPVDDEA